MKKLYFLIYLLLSLTFSTSLFASSQTFSYSQSNLDIMFVVDYSNSMNGNDKNKMALQMIEAFIDSVYSTYTRVGFVAYNHTILDSTAPIPISSNANVNDLKKSLMNIRRLGSTDIGLALSHAVELLSQDPTRQSVIILISDGEPDLSYVNTGRTLQDSYSDMTEAGSICANLNIPIYPIAFGSKFDGSTSSLKTLAEQTSATAYTASQPSDLIEIFNTILKNYTMSSIIPIGASLSTGNLQTINIPIEHDYANEANLLVVSSSPIKDANIFYSGNDITFNKSDYYFTSKIISPKQGSIKLQLSTSAHQDIKIYLLLYQDADFILEMPKTIYKNTPFELSAYFIDNQTQIPITNMNFYQQFLAQANFSNSNGVSGTDSTMPFEDGRLRGHFTLPLSGFYTLNYSLKGNTYSLELNTPNILCTNSAPSGNFEEELSYHSFQEPIIFDLNKYFTDNEQDLISYTIDVLSGDSASVSILDNQLTIVPNKVGPLLFTIVAKDSENALHKSNPTKLTILPIWKYYQTITLLSLLVILLIIISMSFYFINKYRKAPKPFFSGKINIYFTKSPDDFEELLPLSFALYQMPPHEIKLFTLLKDAGLYADELNCLDSLHIALSPGLDKNLIFSHTSNNSIMIGSSIACKKTKHSLSYGNKIYITSENDQYELEIHYISCKA